MEHMKYFILKLLLFVITLYALTALYLLNFPTNYLPPQYAIWKYKSDISSGTTSLDFAPEVLILGDSLSLVSANPLLIGDKVFSLAIDGSSPIERSPTRGLSFSKRCL